MSVTWANVKIDIEMYKTALYSLIDGSLATSNRKVVSMDFIQERSVLFSSFEKRISML